MNNAELKDALLSGAPVIMTMPDGTESEYLRVSAIVYRANNGRVNMSAEVLDKCGRSVTLCDPKRLRLKTGGDGVV